MKRPRALRQASSAQCFSNAKSALTRLTPTRRRASIRRRTTGKYRMSSFNWPPLYEPYSPPAQPTAPPRPPRRRRRFVALAIFLLFCAAAVFVFLTVGKWLVIEDPIAPADAIVVLSGRLPERAIEAARLYHQGLANEVWISPGESPADELAQLNIHYLGEDF